MRKIASLLSVLMLLCTLALGQTRTVTGVVRDDKGDPIPFATIQEVGTNNATQADQNGRFTISVSENAQLSISSTGFTARTFPASGDLSNISLVRAEGQLQEVVVTTAFGVTRSQRVTPYSAQVIDRGQLGIIPQTNLNNALAGKIAGVQFRGQSPMKLNTQGSLRLRGGLALGGDLEALYVVDGTPVNSFDINPDDIESVTVLKGANATALFGDRAAGGAVVITTRKRGDRNTAGIEVSQGVTFDKVYILPEYQNLYAGGSTGDLLQFTWRPGMPSEWQALNGKFYHDYTDDASWGPRMIGQEYAPWYSWIPGHAESGTTTKLVPQPDNARDFYRTGVTNVTNVSFSKGGQGYNARISYTNNSIRGMIPNSSSKRNTLFTSASLDLGNHFVLATNVTFTNQRINGEFTDAYSNQSTGSFNSWFHRNLDMDKLRQYRDLRTPIGTLASWNFRNNPDAGNANNVYRANYWYNFFSYFDAIDYQQDRDRLVGDASLTYRINDAFRIRGTVRKNSLLTQQEYITPSELQSSAVQTGVLANYTTAMIRSNEMNYEGLASWNEQFIDNRLVVSLNAGANLLKFRYASDSAYTAGGLNVPNLYSIGNSKNQPGIGNKREGREIRSAFAFGDIEFNRMFAASFAVRNDWYSTLPAGNNSLLSPSVGASFIFTDLTKDFAPVVSYGKIFGSWGKKPLSLNIYQNNFLYTVNPNQFSGNFLMTTPNSNIDSGVTGALITTFEVGLDARFVQNRYGINVTYYDETSEDPPITIAVPGTTGFTSLLINDTRVQRKGIEVVLSARPIVRRDFNWELTKNFGYIIDNTVTELLPGQNRILLAGGAFGTRFARVFHELNEDWGQLIGGGIKRNDQGQPLLDANGMYTVDADKHWGSVVPKLTGGLVNTLSWKFLTFGFNIDYQVGGKFFSLSEQWGHYSGLLKATAATNDKGYNVRDAVADGGGVHVVGVAAADGRTPVDKYVDAQTYFHQFYNTQIAEPFVHSLTFVKLRELSLGYQIPLGRIGGLSRWFKGANASVVARNPLLIYRETKNFDPSEISGLHGEDGQYPGTRSIGFNLRFNF